MCHTHTQGMQFRCGCTSMHHYTSLYNIIHPSLVSRISPISRISRISRISQLTWGCVKTWYLFKWPPVDKNFDVSSFLWVGKHPWSRVNRCHLLFSFPFIAFHFAFISSHVPFILLSCPFMSFHVPLLCMYQRYRSSKTDMLKPVRWVSAQTLAFFEYVVIVYAIV